MIIIYDILTDMSNVETYSFSKLNADCMYCYYLDYVADRSEKLPKVNNGFAQVGTLAHSILEDFGNGKLAQFELKDSFLDQFDSAVPYGVKLVTDGKDGKKFTKDLTENYKNSCGNFFEKFDGIDIGEQISAEEDFKLLVKIKNKTLILRGIIDCVIKDSSGEYHLYDYKSKSAFKSEEELFKYTRQLYLYSIYIKYKYGKYPKTLNFLQFRIDHTETIVFSEDNFNETLQWVYNQTEVLEHEQFWSPKCLEEVEKQKQGLKPDFFMANNLCSYRFSCPYSPNYKGDE